MAFTARAFESALKRKPSSLFCQRALASQFRLKSTHKKLTLDVIKQLPKAELHLHLDGSLRISTILELAKEQGITLPANDVAGLKKIVSIEHRPVSSLVEFLKGFDLTLSVLQKPYAITRGMYEVCEDAVADGVRYLEVRFSPVLHQQQGMSLSQVMEAICEGQAMAEANLPITVRIIVCGMRQLHPSVTQRLAEIAWRYQSKGVAAFDLAGPELGFSSKIHRAAFDIVRKQHLNCTLHSGEASGWQSIMDSIHYCGAHRIGHGVQLSGDATLMKYVVDRRITVESCVTSNIQTKAVEKLEDHPIRKFFDAGVLIVPCTDNTTISNVTLSSEYKLLQDSFGFAPNEIFQLIDNGFRSAFVHSTLKKRLRIEALQTAAAVLHEAGHDISGLNLPRYQRLGLQTSSAPTVPAAPVAAAPPPTATPAPSDAAAASGAASVVASASAGAASTPAVPAQTHGYWGGHGNPPITKELLQSLPKVDLHCRLDGSVSLATMWNELQAAPSDVLADAALTLKSPEELRQLMQPETHSEATDRLARRVMRSLLQTRAQVERGFEDIVRSAVEQSVNYMEVVFRPVSHMQKEFKSSEEVVDLFCDIKARLESAFPIRLGLVIYSHALFDDPIVFRANAELALKYRERGVCGYGILGGDLPPSGFQYFQSTFDFLKWNNINVVMTAGTADAQHIVPSLYDAGASRISGGFQLHRDPDLLNYVADHRIPLELSPYTRKFMQFTQDVRTFAGSPLRLYLDNHVAIAPCSFHATLSPRTRTDELFMMVRECNLSISEVLQVLNNGFVFNFQSYQARKELSEAAWTKSVQLLSSQGFQYLHPKSFFPAAPPKIQRSVPGVALF
eukprot:TRINITY_DN5309_c0_g1_i1.p1 TRINITY_DN5309_c0_g1~~TRINITY_DN5309_c0_g1_i1.p1  ORF type:complete len:847 (-),score=257.76 TRINITY_DN5309_c0_g1_i1:93-2633(-)